MTVTLTLDPVNGTAVFTGLSPSDIGAVSQAVYNTLASRVGNVESSITNINTLVNSHTTDINVLQDAVEFLNPSDVGLSNILQNGTTGEINLNSNVFVDGQVTAYAKLETRLSEHGLNIQPWDESTRYSCRLDLWSNDSSKEHEISVFRDTYSTNSKVGLAVYKPNRTDTINAYISGNGNSYLCANNGNVGVGTNNPGDKFTVSGGYVRCTSGLKLGSNANKVEYGTAAPTSGTYARGDRVVNQSPSASGNVGWVCVTAGSPGTWKTYGTISA